MGAELTPRQRGALQRAKTGQEYVVYYTGALEACVHHAIREGVPVNTLARALGVSRSRIRRLAR
jgi:hypothetical protein